jgi:hypothetical protein
MLFAQAADSNGWEDALPSLVAIAVVIIGGVIQWKVAGRQIDAARTDAAAQITAAEKRWVEEQAFERAKLIRADRSAVYVAVLAFASRLVRIAQRTHPVMEPAPEPPPWPDELELELLYARLDAFGSSAVRDRLVALFDVMREFHYDAANLSRLRENERTKHSDETLDCWKKLEDLRGSIGPLVDSLREAVSLELGEARAAPSA